MNIFIMTFYAIYRFVSPVLIFYKSRHCWIKQVYERNDMQLEALICLYLKKKLRKIQPESLVLMLVVATQREEPCQFENEHKLLGFNL